MLPASEMYIYLNKCNDVNETKFMLSTEKQVKVNKIINSFSFVIVFSTLLQLFSDLGLSTLNKLENKSRDTRHFKSFLIR